VSAENNVRAIPELAEFVSHFKDQDLPTATRDAISRHVLDLISATAAGLHSPLAKAARKSALAAYGDGPCSIWLTAESSSVVGAAMANSASASALDIDDGHRGSGGHPGAGVIPAALAVGQAVGSSDAEIMSAIALGYEVGLRIAASRPVETVELYATGRWVNYGAAVAAARLLKLSAAEVAHAIGIAGLEGPVIYLTANTQFEGSSVKEGIPPAVVAGITAAYRARSGATGPLDLLDDQRRFIRPLLTGKLGETWEVQRCYLKPYACCRYMHAAVDAIVELREQGLPIQALKIETFPQALRLANERAPTSLEGGQYSFYFSCAIAALHGPEALQPVKIGRLADKEVLELAARIELEASPEFVGAFPVGTPARVVIDQGSGAKEKTVLHPLGDVANPLSGQQVTDKFRNLAAGVIDERWQKDVLTAVDELGTAGFEPFFRALRPPGERIVVD
jgi:2-methylcitrate dehydratase PrpD